MHHKPIVSKVILPKAYVQNSVLKERISDTKESNVLVIYFFSILSLIIIV